MLLHLFVFFFFNDTATTEIYTLSLHDALPIFGIILGPSGKHCRIAAFKALLELLRGFRDRKSTRLNSSHGYISYAVFCLKKKNTNQPYPSFAAQYSPRQPLTPSVSSLAHTSVH